MSAKEKPSDMAGSVPVRPSLVDQFDEIVAANNVLCSGTEAGEYIEE